MQASHIYLSQGVPQPQHLWIKDDAASKMCNDSSAHGCEGCERWRPEFLKLEVVSSRVLYKCALCMCLCIRRQVSIEPNHLRYSCWHIESLILSTLPHTLFRVLRAKNADLVISEGNKKNTKKQRAHSSPIIVDNKTDQMNTGYWHSRKQPGNFAIWTGNRKSLCNLFYDSRS